MSHHTHTNKSLIRNFALSPDSFGILNNCSCYHLQILSAKHFMTPCLFSQTKVPRERIVEQLILYRDATETLSR
jgi:hypothetical protein